MRRRQTRAWQRGGMLAAVAILMSVGTWQFSTDLYAQAPAPSGVPNLSGMYQRSGRGGGEGVWSLNARAKAIIAAFDEAAGPKWDCVAATSPRIITDPYNFRIEQQADRVLLYYEKDDVVRTVWLEGHSIRSPRPANIFCRGTQPGGSRAVTWWSRPLSSLTIRKG